MFSKFSRFTKLQNMPEGCDAVNDDGACIKQQTPWVSPCSCKHLHVRDFSHLFAGEEGKRPIHLLLPLLCFPHSCTLFVLSFVV